LKKTLPIFLLAILLFNISGHFFIFKVSQYSLKTEIKRKIKNQVPETELTIISFSIAELNTISWEENGKEFWHNGNLYDVVKKHETTDNISFHCINDKQEKALFAHLEELINRQMNSDAESNNTSLKKFQSDYFFVQKESEFSFTEISCLQTAAKEEPLKGFLSESLQPPERA
jgi:hypothetical protein